MHFEGQDWRDKRNVKGVNWIEPPRRERKVHYGVNQFVLRSLARVFSRI
jgi:hypothetical protein